MVRVAGSAERSLEEALPEIEVLVVGPDGALLAADSPFLVEDYWRVLDDGTTEMLDHRARSQVASAAPAASAEDSTRRGGLENIERPVRVDPARARMHALGGELFAAEIERLTIDESSLTVDARGLTWEARVKTRLLWRRRRASLCLHASPSTNLTVIELTPERPRRRRGASFVRAGVRAVEVLSERLTVDAERGPNV